MKKRLLNIIYGLIITLFITGISVGLYCYINGIDILQLLISLSNNIYIVIGILLLLHILRIFLFIPSTLLIIATGIITDNFLLTSIISFVGIGLGLAETYLIGYIFEEEFKNGKMYKKIAKYNKIIKEKGFFVIMGWSFFPAVPTDLICYAAGFVRYNFTKYMTAALIGEIPLILGYSYLGILAGEYIQYAIYLLIPIIMYFLYTLYKKRNNKNEKI